MIEGIILLLIFVFLYSELTRKPSKEEIDLNKARGTDAVYYIKRSDGKWIGY